MKKKYLLPAIVVIILFSGLQQLIAQNVAINSTGNAPDVSAMLDVQSANKGLLIPRVTLLSLTDVTTIPTPANSLLVYNSVATFVPLGYYYNSGTTTSAVWEKLSVSTDVFAMSAIGATPNANGATLSGSTLTLQPANANYGGVITTGTQTIAGAKTFTGMLMPLGRLMLPMGELSVYNYTGLSVTISGTSSGASGNDNMSKINPSGVNFVNDGFGTGTTTRLTYTGATTRYFHIALSFSFTPGATGDLYVFGVAQNGTVKDASKIILKSGNTADHQSSAIHVLLSLNQNDYLEFYVGKIGATGTITIKSFNFVAIGM